MLVNNLRSGWRNLSKHSLHATINITGLAVGMAVSFLLLLYVYNECSFDKFNLNSDRLYLVFKNQSTNAEVKTKPLSPQPLAAALKSDFPEVEDVARTNYPENSLISYHNNSLKIPTVAADPALLSMFTFDLVSGSMGEALTGSSTIVLTQSAALAIFGKENPVGRIIQYNKEFPLTVTAVIEDNPANSSLTFKAIISWESLLFQRPWLKNSGWDNYSYSTYVLLKPGVSPGALNSKIKTLPAKYDPANKAITLFLYPLTKLHLYNRFQNGVSTGGRIEYVQLFLILAFGILIIACINFMNLSTARAGKRAREVGVRKTLGARRLTLVKQFMVESLLMTFVAFACSMLLILIAIPFFNIMAGTRLELPYQSVRAWSFVLAIALFTGLVSGSYPAFFLSSFNAARVIKGPLLFTKTMIRPRQLLVIVQFTFAIGLIVSSIFIYRQINYIKGRPVGYERGGLIEMPADGTLNSSFESFRQEAINTGAISDAASTSGAITNNQSSTWDITWPNQLPGEDKIPIDCIAVTYHFLSTYGLILSRGRDFDPGRPADSTAIILNEAAVKMMRLREPLGSGITWQGAKRNVIGVIKDFIWGSPYEPVKPAIIGFMKDWTGNIGLRLSGGMPVEKSLSLVQNVYKKYNPGYPFEYTFTGEDFSKKYRDERLLGTISLAFTSLAIFISCLGLFGLASFSAEQQRKEMGIRKVLGASAFSLWFKLSREFVLLVIIAFVTGSILSWYFVHGWLTKYTFHTPFSIWVFVITLVLSIGICLAAVSWQAIRAAFANPVKSLRSE